MAEKEASGAVMGTIGGLQRGVLPPFQVYVSRGDVHGALHIRVENYVLLHRFMGDYFHGSMTVPAHKLRVLQSTEFQRLAEDPKGGVCIFHEDRRGIMAVRMQPRRAEGRIDLTITLSTRASSISTEVLDDALQRLEKALRGRGATGAEMWDAQNALRRAARADMVAITHSVSLSELDL
jgi:hypothetical protein